MNEQKEEFLLDFSKLWKVLKKSWFRILIFIVFVTSIVFMISMFVLPKRYQATTKMYIVNRNTNILREQGLDLEDYKDIILSRDVIDELIKEVHLNTSYRSVLSNISISANGNGNLVKITYKSTNPKLTAIVANKLRELSIKKIGEIVMIDHIIVVEKATVPDKPFSPEKKKILVLTIMASFLCSFLFYTIKTLRDTTVKDPETLEDELKVVLLGIVTKHIQLDEGK